MSDDDVKHLALSRHVPGWLWMSGKAAQEQEKQAARQDFDVFVAAEGWELVSDVRETLTPNEREKAMLIEYRAEGVRR